MELAPPAHKEAAESALLGHAHPSPGDLQGRPSRCTEGLPSACMWGLGTHITCRRESSFVESRPPESTSALRRIPLSRAQDTVAMVSTQRSPAPSGRLTAACRHVPSRCLFLQGLRGTWARKPILLTPMENTSRKAGKGGHPAVGPSPRRAFLGSKSLLCNLRDASKK